jgi:hydroxyethylthiazole kinase
MNERHSGASDAGALLREAARLADAVRETSPLVDCLTNFVTVNDCANVLLAFGASPAMCDAQDEAFDFVQLAGAAYINFGTYIKEHEMAGYQMALGAKLAGKPVVVDPVGCGAIPHLFGVLARICRTGRVDLIKGNMGEVMALAGHAGATKGVDSDGDIAGVEEAAVAVARKYGCTVAATGKADVITDGTRLARLHNGTELLTKITGAGCMAGALCGATAAVAGADGDMLAAAVAAITAMSLAGERAAKQARLPGSFRVALVDCVAEITGSALLAEGRIECRCL